MSLARHNPARDSNEPAIKAALGVYCHVHAISGKGIPDLLCAVHGRWFLVEVKTPNGKLTQSQQDFFRAARLWALPVYVARSVDDVEQIIKDVLTCDSSPK